jgi:hypothetical protein
MGQLGEKRQDAFASLVLPLGKEADQRSEHDGADGEGDAKPDRAYA